jgi:ATP-dependent RNA helicase DHX57
VVSFAILGGPRGEDGTMRCCVPAGKRSAPAKTSGFEQIIGIGEKPGEEYAALNVLHQVEHGKPLERLLAPEYREVWLDMDRRFAEAKAAKERATFRAEKRRKAEERSAKAAKKAETATINISAESRHIIEDALLGQRTSSSSVFELNSSSLGSVELTNVARGGSEHSTSARIAAQLREIGFTNRDSEAASLRFKELHSALDFLCLNVDETELPPSFAPAADIEILASGRRVNGAAAELLSSVLCTSKYAAEKALRASKDNVPAALSSLFCSLTGIAACQTSHIGDDVFVTAESEKQSEVEVLKAIYGGEVAAGMSAVFEFPDQWGAVVTLEGGLPAFGCHCPLRVCVVDVDGLYPLSPPAVFITVDSTDFPLVRRRAAIRAASSRILSVRSGNILENREPFPMVHAIASFLVESSEILLLEAAAAACPSDLLPTNPALNSFEGMAGQEGPADYNTPSANQRSEVEILNPESCGYAKPIRVRKPRPLGVEGVTRARQTVVKPSNGAHVGEPSLQSNRRKLPAFQSRGEILSIVQENQVTVISGATGSGKTTQIPQFLLEEASETRNGISVVCTQPRRIAAISVAERVASERCERVGQSVGYQVKLNTKRSDATRLIFCTTGVVLRRMQSDPTLLGLTHIIVDECHERSVETDFLLILLRDVLLHRPALRVILMSATLDASKFSTYFSEVTGRRTPVISIPGRTFPVTELYLEDAVLRTSYKLRAGDRYAIKQSRLVGNIKTVNEPPYARLTEVNNASTVESNGDSQLQVHRQADGSNHDEIPDDWDASDSESDAKMTSNVPDKGAANSVAEIQCLEVSKLIDESQVNMDLIDLLVRQLDKDMNDSSAGAILIFLPGTAEIAALVERLSRGTGSSRLFPMPLHSALSPDEQGAVFGKPPKGRRKIICSTNIAETSVTVEDVTVVIDTARVKEMTYDSLNGTSVLTETFISQAAGRQRTGRAGRVSHGTCYRLVRKSTFENKLNPHQEPEIRRVSLEHLVLNLLSIVPSGLPARDPHEFLSRAMDPPDREAVTAAVTSLIAIGALKNDFRGTSEPAAGSISLVYPAVCLTPLGRHLSGIPADARIGKLLIFGTIFGCLDAALTISACMSERSPFFSPRDDRDAARIARQKFAWGKSDLLLYLKAYDSWTNVRGSGGGYKSELDFCSTHFMSRKTLLAISDSRRQLENALQDAGFTRARESNENATNLRVIRAVLCAALYPNIVRIDPPDALYREVAAGAVAQEHKARDLILRAKSGERVFLHPESVNFDEGDYDSRWLAYFSKVRTSRVFIRDATMVSPLGILLFGGGIEVRHTKEQLVVDDWAVFKSPARVAVLVRELRRNLDGLLIRKFENPGLDVHKEGRSVNDAILQLIKKES